MFYGLIESTYDATIKYVIITVLCDPDADVYFSDYDDPTDGLLSSENVDEEVETKKLWRLGVLRTLLLTLIKLQN